jgi:cytochrome bd ubiquinol oxidase subunit II
LASRGLEAALNLQNLSLGLAVFFLSRVLACLYFFRSIDNDEIIADVKKQLLYNAIPFLVFFLLFTGMLLLKNGFAVNPATAEVFMQPYKYFKNLIEMPVVALLFLSGVVLVLAGIILPVVSYIKHGHKAIILSGLGTVITVFSIFLLAGFNNTAYYPSVADMQSSLTIFNSSSSQYTLKIMSYVSLFIPFVLAYIIYVWRVLTSKKSNISDMDKEHVY